VAPRRLTLSRQAALAMSRHAEEGYPHEVVGILVGSGDRVRDVEALVNERADSPANRYHVSALALHRREQAIEARGDSVLGYYHSHPDHPAVYSDFDRDHALPNLSYVILSVLDGVTSDVLCWWLREDRSAMDPQPLSFEDAP
jgi:proteasome lid subunit RPN8/RPN11